MLENLGVAMPRWKFLRRDYANPRLISGSAFWSGNVIQAGGAFPADQYCEITLATITVSAVGVAFPIFLRIAGQSTGTYYFVNLGIAIGGQGSYALNAVVANTKHPLVAQTNTTIAVGDVWRLSVTGNVLTLSRNGSTITTFTDTNNYVAGAGAVGFSAYNTNSAVITDSQISLFAAGGNQAAAPTFSPNGGSFGPSQTVTISSTTSGGTIFYTTDGSTPTHSSSSISNGGTISVSSTSTVKAFASVSNFADSTTASASFTINGAVAASTFSPSAGSYATAQSVTVSNANSGLAGFAQYYTTDGSTPTTGSTPVTGPIVVAGSLTLKVSGHSHKL